MFDAVQMEEHDTFEIDIHKLVDNYSLERVDKTQNLKG
jgi:hypothetical protein